MAWRLFVVVVAVVVVAVAVVALVVGAVVIVLARRHTVITRRAPLRLEPQKLYDGKNDVIY